MLENYKVRILIVEDSKSLGMVYAAIARQLDVVVRVADTGTQAMAIINEFEPEIILLDLLLPDVRGLDILRYIQKQDLKIATIVMTANGTVDYAVESMRLGAYDFLEKPISADRLRTTLNNTIEKIKLSALAEPFIPGNGIPGGFIGESPAIKAVYDRISRVRYSNAAVFITGESGTGKEVTANALHEMNTSRKGPFVAINCAAIPRELMESELFGHVKGAFTGATQDHQGAVSLADGGTLFLDELCEMSIDLQSKLLRFLQSSVFHKVGSAKDEKVDVRIICATNRNPMEEIQKGRFREDLFYRLYVIHIHLPPLRQRGFDVVLIARYFLKKYSEEEKKGFIGFSKDAEEYLMSRTWPGNVRQLQNMVHQAVVLNTGKVMTRDMLPRDMMQGDAPANKNAVTSDTFMRNTGSIYNAPAHFFGTDGDYGAINGYKISGTPGAVSEAPRNDPPPVRTSSSGELPPVSRDAAVSFSVDITSAVPPLEEVEKRYILEILRRNSGSVSRTAEMLGLVPSTLYRKISRWQKSGEIVKTGEVYFKSAD
ncbi:sigma-54-dependent transcriptional regulator [Succinimonas amylolytica]|uniref:sigma-54-dependent transcriptional regulator n=1 Tax=Succinimonas amylolytica TaxID=83769 RepID=UPI00037DAB9A|nr:sigma-54 dependent transcriptional regulator [Succinimonas amylolytica]